MPKGLIYKIPIDKGVFKDVVKEQGSSIRQLGESESVECTERTIRRSLNEGKMTPCFLDQIARFLDVDPRLLSGELHKQADGYRDEFLKNIYLAQLTTKRYPYYRKRKTDLLKQQPLGELYERILSLFEISFSQFEALDFEEQYLFQHDLLDALVPVIRKHFEVDAYGREDMPDLERITYELEDFREDHYRHLYAEEVLRKQFLRNPPQGKTRAEIRRMDAEELIALDMEKASF